jgi:hypothetical protein
MRSAGRQASRHLKTFTDASRQAKHGCDGTWGCVFAEPSATLRSAQRTRVFSLLADVAGEATYPSAKLLGGHVTAVSYRRNRHSGNEQRIWQQRGHHRVERGLRAELMGTLTSRAFTAASWPAGPAHGAGGCGAAVPIRSSGGKPDIETYRKVTGSQIRQGLAPVAAGPRNQPWGAASGSSRRGFLLTAID